MLGATFNVLTVVPQLTRTEQIGQRPQRSQPELCREVDGSFTPFDMAAAPWPTPRPRFRRLFCCGGNFKAD